MSRNALFKAVTERVNPQIQKYAYKYQNAARDPEDIAQDLRVKILTFLEKNNEVFQHVELDEVVAQVVVVVRNCAIDMVRRAVNRPDESIYHASVDDLHENGGFDSFGDSGQEGFLTVFAGQEHSAVASDVQKKLFERVTEPDLRAYLTACLNPSKELLEYFEEWRSQKDNHSKNRAEIPPRVVGRFLGFDGTKVTRLQRKLTHVFLDLGFSLPEIWGFKECKGKEDGWFASYNRTRQGELG
jgi:DNA-directed RNA polymerase specialized sigma24 family protein